MEIEKKILNLSLRKCYRDAVGIVFFNAFASLLGGFAVFGFLGFMAWKMGTTIEQVATAGKR